MTELLLSLKNVLHGQKTTKMWKCLTLVNVGISVFRVKLSAFERSPFSFIVLDRQALSFLEKKVFVTFLSRGGLFEFIIGADRMRGNP